MNEPVEIIRKDHRLYRNGGTHWWCTRCGRLYLPIIVGSPSLLPWCRPLSVTP